MAFNHELGEFLETDGGKIYYEVKGEKESPALVFLHGGLGNMEDFNAVVDGLDKKFRVIGIDSRGQGKSTLGSGVLSYEQMQKDVGAVLKHLGIDSVSIIGFSDGGLVACRLAALTSLNIEKLVTIGTHWHFKDADAIHDLLASVTGESWRKKFPETYESYQKWNPEPDFDGLVQAVVKMWLDETPSGYLNEAVEKISCPLLMVRGDDDHLVSRETVFELGNIIEGSRLLSIPFAGHVAFEDQKEIFMLSLNQFLDS